jgi:penicillin-binding protein 1A
MQQAGGARSVVRVAVRLGIADKLPIDASLALGTGEVSLLELTGAYAAFFNGGLRVTPHGVATGPRAAQPVIDPDLATAMVRMMTAVATRGTGRAAAVPGHDVAGKTGTTQDYRDAWFVGCIDGRVIGVWLGNDDNRPMKSVQGGGLPARLFHDIAVSMR